jgi:AraC-like DNA-binding protein
MISGHMYGYPSSVTFPLYDSFRDGGVLDIARSSDQALMGSAHRHPHGELFLLRSGHLTSHSETGHWLIPAGQICWIPPNAPHGADSINTVWTRIHIAAGLSESLPSHPCVWTSTPLIRAVIDKLAQRPGKISDPSPADERLLAVLFDELAIARSASIALPMPKSPNLRAIAAEWQRSPGEMSDVDGLAAESSMSRRTFTRTFRQETGMSVGRWRQLARLMHGLDLLLAGVSVTDTAMCLGYDSVSSFVTLCQRHTGMSPKALAEAIPQIPN